MFLPLPNHLMSDDLQPSKNYLPNQPTLNKKKRNEKKRKENWFGPNLPCHAISFGSPRARLLMDGCGGWCLTYAWGHWKHRVDQKIILVPHTPTSSVLNQLQLATGVVESKVQVHLGVRRRCPEISLQTKVPARNECTEPDKTFSH